MTIASLTESGPWLVAGWTMLHFLWIGGVLGLVAAGGRRMLRAARPEVRHGFALACLAALALAPVVIGLLLVASSEPRPTGAVRPILAAPVPLPPPVEMLEPAPPATLPEPERTQHGSSLVRESGGLRWERLPGAAAAVLPWLWLGGAPATFALLAAGLIGAERLRRQGRPLTEGELPALARRLADALGIARPVALAVCDRLVAPVLIGVVRPLILLPPTALTGWSVEQIEMALLHELAHVRRRDNLVNLVQRLVESVLFFHPVVWWVSGWVRLEREHCCDRLVVAQTGRARPYAELLAALAVPESRPGRAAVAMAESPVVARIRRILNMEDPSMRVSRPVVALAAGLLLAPIVLIASHAAAPDPDEGPKPEPAAPPAQERFDPEKVEDLFRRARHGAEMFRDVQGRAYALSRIASAQVRLGDRDAARQTYRDAVAVGETVSLDDSMYSPHILQWIARAQGRNGFRDDAIETLRTLLRIAEAPVKRDVHKANLYDNILQVQVELDDQAGIQETLRHAWQFNKESQERGVSAFAPASLVRLQAISGDLAGALRMIDDPELFQNPNPLARLAAELFQGQNSENVKNLRLSALFWIVQTIGPNNREGADAVLEAARRAADAKKDDLTYGSQTSRNQNLGTIAVALARLGRFAEARETAGAINAENPPGNLADATRDDYLNTQGFNKAQAFATIAQAQMEAGDRDGARQSARDVFEIVEAIPEESWRGNPLQRAIRVLAEAGEPAEALRHADAMDPSQRVRNYESVALAQREAGDEAGARETLQAALKIVREQIAATPPALGPDRLPDADQARNQWQSQAAHLQALLGDVGGAIATARRINHGSQEVEALKRVAVDRAAADDLDGALEAIAQINGPKAEAEALEEVTSAIARRAATPGR